ncbi:hypothetical protein [Burkholderia ubonensis]|uniref:hypothetical protein n=1 Tax=Burkholderia ubonensis TaxID=101571 RepID=UPI000B1F06C9|nr:hypothetical protein [Burkholderia ubonensis]
MNEIPAISAAARVILRLCDDEVDVRTSLERIAYAAAVIAQRANEQIEKLKTARESNHG